MPNQDVGKFSIKHSCCFHLEHHSPLCALLHLSPNLSPSSRENCRIISSLPVVFQSPMLIPLSLFSQALLTTCHVPVSSTSQQRPCFLSFFFFPWSPAGCWAHGKHSLKGKHLKWAVICSSFLNSLVRANKEVFISQSMSRGRWKGQVQADPRGTPKPVLPQSIIKFLSRCFKSLSIYH